MSARGTFQFGPYTLRPTTKVDGRLAREWTHADPWHRETVDPGFWLEQGQYADAYLLLDQDGPLYFARLIVSESSPRWREVEMHIQFPPVPADEAGKLKLRARVARGLIHGLTWLERMLKGISARELYFDSRTESLKDFCVRRLGFEDKGGGRLVKKLWKEA